MADRLSEMETFICVVEEENLSAAGRRLGISPSGVSRILSGLERRLKTPLAIRSSRHLRLTPEGELFYNKACKIVDQIERAEYEVRDGTAQVSGLLRVSTTIPFALNVIAPILSGFLEKYPDIRVEFDYNDHKIDLIFEHTDLAIRSGPLSDSSLIARRLYGAKRKIVGSPAYLDKYGTPETLKDLEEHNCLQFNAGNWTSKWPMKVDSAEQETLEFPVSGRLSFNDGEALRRHVLLGVGLARLAEFHIGEDLRKKKLVPVLEHLNPEDVEYISAIYPAQSHLPARVRVFIDYLVENL